MNKEALALIVFEAEGTIPEFTRNKRLAKELAEKSLNDIEEFEKVEIERIRPADTWFMVDFKVEGGTQSKGKDSAEALFYAEEEIEVTFNGKFNELGLATLEITDREIVDWEAV